MIVWYISSQRCISQRVEIRIYTYVWSVHWRAMRRGGGPRCILNVGRRGLKKEVDDESHLSDRVEVYHGPGHYGRCASSEQTQVNVIYYECIPATHSACIVCHRHQPLMHGGTCIYRSSVWDNHNHITMACDCRSEPAIIWCIMHLIAVERAWCICCWGGLPKLGGFVMGSNAAGNNWARGGLHRELWDRWSARQWRQTCIMYDLILHMNRRCNNTGLQHFVFLQRDWAVHHIK
jgi:hypothetical protein